MPVNEEYRDQVLSMFKKKTDFRLEGSEESKEYSLYVYGGIGGYFWSENSAQRIRQKLQDVDAKTIHVHINSPGGSAFDGVAIMNLLKNHKAEIIVHVDGYAASAASVIAMAGDKVIMPENTMMMIHRASTFAWGNAAALEKSAKDLRKIDTALAASYKKRFVGEEGELEQLLDEETWLTADEAVAFGLADVVEEEIEIKELEDLDDDEEDEGDYENLKDKLVAKYSAKKKEEVPSNIEPEQDSGEPKRNLASLFLNLK
ncbi:head maturation protease, ClpP-related [Evansella clarkii]|uniref:head maturation protease, ClpP-related n=1 Tax=Evansella clarkii TaxID=79879 RepID=UPI000B447BB7|nr:head maturation protease, ClpP-related [Evansella clarkii]